MKVGKSAKTALISAIALSLILGTAAFIQFQVSATIVKASVEIDPDRVDLAAYPGRFKFKLWFSGKYKNYNVSDIRRKTILIDGVLKPQGPWKIKDGTLTFRVKGNNLINYVIWPKIYHMARVDPNPDKGTWFPYKIDITVTGQFDDGTQFTGTDTIHVYVSQDAPPPPPPP